MGYVAIKGGSEAIVASIERLRFERLRSGRTLSVERIEAGMRGLIDLVMSEGSLYHPATAAHCIKQAEGSPEEAVFLLRAFRSTLPRLHDARELDPRSMRVERRISATFKEVPGGQILGASYDYLHRLLDPALLSETDIEATDWLARWWALSEGSEGDDGGQLPKVLDYLRNEGLMPRMEMDPKPPSDITTRAWSFPARRSERLQVLSRGNTGAVVALGYASLRGYGPLLHPTVGELRVGSLPVTIDDPLAEPTDANDADAYYLGSVRITEVESVVPLATPQPNGRARLRFDLGYGACFGQNETKAIAMSLLDQCLEHPNAGYPTHDEEFVLLHVDSLEASGFISHLKLPHYVTFQSELDSVRAQQRVDLEGDS
jgi:alpha-D-ribose 1-methylphosphonate 5-triphosphate synthase subunit PhnI